MENRNDFTSQTKWMLSLHKPKRFKLRAAVHGAFLGHFWIFLRLIYLHFTLCRVAWNTWVAVAPSALGALAKIHILLASLRATNRIHKDKSKSRHNYHQISLLLRAAFELNHLLASRFVIFPLLLFFLVFLKALDVISFFPSTYPH